MTAQSIGQPESLRKGKARGRVACGGGLGFPAVDSMKRIEQFGTRPVSNTTIVVDNPVAELDQRRRPVGFRTHSAIATPGPAQPLEGSRRTVRVLSGRMDIS